MTDITTTHPADARERTTVQPLYVRITHWINAVAMLVLIGSGWQIYNASPIFPFTFPSSVTLGGWLAGGILWHFAAMWVLVVNGLIYVTLGIVTGRFRRQLWPISPRDLARDTAAALTGRLHHDLSRYNAVQKLLYVGILITGAIIALSGIAIWKPVQFHELTMVFGGFDTARVVHFVAMAAIVAFLVLHVVMALLVPKTLRAMVTGR